MKRIFLLFINSKFYVKSFFIAIVLAACALPLFYFNALSDARNYKSLQNNCMGIRKSVQEMSSTVEAIDPYFCTKEFAQAVDYSQRGMALTDLAYAKTGDEWRGEYLSLIGGIFAFAAFFAITPFAWRFFLNRVAELSKAIRGEK